MEVAAARAWTLEEGKYQEVIVSDGPRRTDSMKRGTEAEGLT